MSCYPTDFRAKLVSAQKKKSGLANPQGKDTHCESSREIPIVNHATLPSLSALPYLFSVNASAISAFVGA
jgi:hypothetical protein